MKTAVVGRSTMNFVFRASFLCVVAAGLLAIGCATPPKPRELDTLEKLRMDRTCRRRASVPPTCARRPTSPSKSQPTSGRATT